MVVCAKRVTVSHEHALAVQLRDYRVLQAAAMVIATVPI